jgi:hypothetical protein
MEFHLFWETASEVNNDFFKILHSSNGTDFTTIGIVTGVGNSFETNKYSFIHSDIKHNTNYYKLLQFDFNGNLEIFKTIIINANLYNELLSLAPNPVNSTSKLSIRNSLRGLINITIINARGQVCLQSSLDKPNEEVFLLLDLSALNSGTYYVILKNDSLLNESIKFNKI